DTFTLVDQAQEDVLGADVVVVQHPGLFLGQDNHPPRAVGEPFEHSHSLTAAPAVSRFRSRPLLAPVPAWGQRSKTTVVGLSRRGPCPLAACCSDSCTACGTTSSLTRYWPATFRPLRCVAGLSAEREQLTPRTGNA